MTLDEALNHALYASSEREEFWFRRVNKAIDRLNIARHHRKTLDALLFDRVVPAQLPMSNQHVRNASRRAFIETVIARRRLEPSIPLLFLTFAGSRGATVLSSPEFDMVAFQRAVYACLRRHGLSGMFSFEFDVVLRRPPETDWTVLFHCHGIASPVEPDRFNIKPIRESMAKSAAFPVWDGAAGTNIKILGSRHIDASRASVYLCDPFHQLKRVQPHKTKPDRHVMRSTRDKLTPGLAIRATEIQSYLPVRDTVFGVGDVGVELRRQWLQCLADHLPVEASQGPSLLPSEVAQLWHHVHAQGSLQAPSGPISIVTRSAMLRTRQ
ncbi:MAG: hypothetical protein ACRYGP_08635 [Janthinobacterium lividum]